MKIIIVGVTGAVGNEFIKLLNERNFQFDDIKLLASKKSVGKIYEIQNKKYIVEELDKLSFKNYNLAFFFVSTELSKKYVPYAIKYGCIVIDNSSAFRMSHPLIIPEINIKEINGSKIIANPNCSTILLCMVLYPLYQKYKMKRLVISTYQSLSGAGQAGMDELDNQIMCYQKGEQINPVFFKSQCLNNIFSHNSEIDIETGANFEELKVINETRKILNDDDIDFDVTCVRVPIMRAHCESVNITFSENIDEKEVTSILQKFPGVIILDDRKNNRFPEPIISSHKDDIFVGRIRVNQKYKNILNLFLSGDQLRKGAALNAIQIAEWIINKK